MRERDNREGERKGERVKGTGGVGGKGEGECERAKERDGKWKG